MPYENPPRPPDDDPRNPPPDENPTQKLPRIPD